MFYICLVPYYSPTVHNILCQLSGLTEPNVSRFEADRLFYIELMKQGLSGVAIDLTWDCDPVFDQALI